MKLEEVASCPVCDSLNVAPLPPVPTRPSEMGALGISTLYFWQCLDCQLGFQNPRMTDEGMEEYYAKLYWTMYPGRNDVELILEVERKHALFIKGFLDRWDVHAETCLDIGSAAGGMLKTLGYNRLGVELGDNFRAYANDHDVETVRHVSEAKGAFDLVLLSHVLEHVGRPVEFLESLKPFMGRHMYIEVPVLHASLPHVIAFTPASLTMTTRLAGLKIVQRNMGPAGWMPPKTGKDVLSVLCMIEEPTWEPI